MHYAGSKWRKWDLHVHTPISIQQEYGGDTDLVWEKYVTQLESLTQPSSVIGVNDYFTIDGYKKLYEYQKTGRLKNIVLFPVIELRVKTFGSLSSDDPWKRVNLHVIFNNQNINEIETQFLNLLDFDYEKTFNRKGLSKEHIIEFGKKVIENTPEDKRNITSPIIAGFNNLNFDHRSVHKLLKESGLEYLIAIGKAEWDALRWDASFAEKKDVVERSDFMFTAAASVDAHKKSYEKLKDNGIAIPLLDCSDAHFFADAKDSKNNPIKDRLGNCFTWIKADKIFEGLKQVIHEPESRVYIGEYQPALPPRRIDALRIKFPADTKIVRREDKSNYDKETDFCLRGDRELAFSPFFTCLIGGRGAGKSTILNIIAKTLGHQIPFFDSNILRSKLGTEEVKDIMDLTDFIEIEGTTEIEYISQNEIEDFARNKEKLTDAIYTRLRQISETDFTDYELKIDKNVFAVSKQLKDVNLIHEKKIELQTASDKLSTDEKIVNSFDNPAYKSLTDSINKVGDEIERSKIGRSKYLELIKALSDLADKFDANIEEPNQLEIVIKNTVGSIKNIVSGKIDLSDLDKELEGLEEKRNALATDLENYLKAQGLSQENINDYERAAKSIPQYKRLINNLHDEIGEIEKALNLFEVMKQTFFADREKLENLIYENLEPLNKKLESKDPNVKDISFRYDFDNEKAKEGLFDDFWSYFENKRPKHFGLNTPSDAVQRLLFESDPLGVLSQTKEQFASKFEQKKSIKEETQAKQYLLRLFEEEVNFETYKLLILRGLINPLKYKSITGFYDSRELRQCSFGQRCTAVIVALLTFGNKPLIIDEPEAHLDSKLIAEYLVNLVKMRKKERQIIFATHNANFVVNGDAELIIHLEVGATNETIVTSMSIENKLHREKLLLLEGGKEAFRKRDARLIKL